MKLTAFTKSWAQAVRENATKNVMLGILIVSNALAILGWFRTEKTVVLVPPQHDERMEISATRASEGYKRAWALTVAQLCGNVTPGTADFVLQVLGDMFAPSAYRDVAAKLAEQVADIKRDSITVSFEPREIRFVPSTGAVYVSGQFASQGVSGQPIKAIRTYEIVVAIRFGRPWITHFRPYEGMPDIDDSGKRRSVPATATGERRS